LYPPKPEIEAHVRVSGIDLFDFHHVLARAQFARNHFKRVSVAARLVVGTAIYEVAAIIV